MKIVFNINKATINMSDFKDVAVNLDEALAEFTQLKADYDAQSLIIDSLVSEKEASAQVIASLHEQITALTGSTNLVADDQASLNAILAYSLTLKNIINTAPVVDADEPSIDPIDSSGQVV